MPIINYYISIISIITYIFNIVSALLFASIIIDRLYISKKFSKENNFDFYNDLFSWEIFFIAIGFINIMEIILLFMMIDEFLSYILFKIIILIMFSAFFMKVFHVQKIMRVITYERHYYMGFILFPIILIFLIFNIPILSLILIFIFASLFPFLLFFSFLRNKEITKKNSIKICIGAIFLAFGCAITAEYTESFIVFNEFLNYLYSIISITIPIVFILGSFLIYDSIRKYL
ncbi:MAG: hypothetical protein ACFFBH_03055 [Promethearchaeota archaeon]